MVYELKKGNKAPYRGFLLGVNEYQRYIKMKELMPEMIQAFEDMRKQKGEGV